MKKQTQLASLKVVNRRQMVAASESGEWLQEATTMYLDTTGEASFVFVVPPYIVSALGVADRVSHATADGAKRAYEALVRRYIEHMKTARAEPVLLVSLSYNGRDGKKNITDSDHHDFFDRGDFDVTRSVGLKYRMAFRVNGSIHASEEVTETGDWPNHSRKVIGHKPAHRLSHPKGKVLDYTPELHAKLDEIVAALDRAAQALHAIDKGPDLLAGIMALGSRPLLSMSPPTETIA